MKNNEFFWISGRVNKIEVKRHRCETRVPYCFKTKKSKQLKSITTIGENLIGQVNIYKFLSILIEYTLACTGVFI